MKIDENIECPKCQRPYSFIRARVTMQNPVRNRCLECGAKEQEEEKRGIIVG